MTFVLSDTKLYDYINGLVRKLLEFNEKLDNSID